MREFLLATQSNVQNCPPDQRPSWIELKIQQKSTCRAIQPAEKSNISRTGRKFPISRARKTWEMSWHATITKLLQKSTFCCHNSTLCLPFPPTFHAKTFYQNSQLIAHLAESCEQQTSTPSVKASKLSSRAAREGIEIHSDNGCVRFVPLCTLPFFTEHSTFASSEQ